MKSPKEKYIEEKDEMKSLRMNRILKASFDLFSEKGIDTIAMTDIAKTAEIGVASLYRYYSTKDEIAIRTAIWAWNTEKNYILPKLDDDWFKNLNGIKQVEQILNLFIELYEKDSNFFRFIYFFDSYIIRTKIETERLVDYERMIGIVQNIVKQSIEKGLSDGSINPVYKDSVDVLYFTLMHSVFSMTQKLCLSGNMLNMDKSVNGKFELQTLFKLLIEGLK